MYTDTEQTLQVFSAGVAKETAAAAIEKWNGMHPEIPAKLTVDGSVNLIRRTLSGEPCDVLIVADDKIIASMMLPQNARGYIVFAGNKMVIAANPGHEISSENWKEKLLDPRATFDHHSPYADPGGYRAVMAMMLAEKVEPGLAEKLLHHPGHFGMEKEPEKETPAEIMYSFEYYSKAVSREVPFATLPEIMDLSNDTLANEYATAAFAVDDNNTVTATPICHALTIPEAAKHRQPAQEFSRLFLKTDFPAYGFIPRHRTVGETIL